MAAQRPQRARRNPRQDALYYCSLGEDKEGFDIRYIDSFKGEPLKYLCNFFSMFEINMKNT